MSAQSDGNYLYRHKTPALDQALADTPVVCLLGPRQCGKSTLARQSTAEETLGGLIDIMQSLPKTRSNRASSPWCMKSRSFNTSEA